MAKLRGWMIMDTSTNAILGPSPGKCYVTENDAAIAASKLNGGWYANARNQANWIVVTEEEMDPDEPDT